MNGSMRAGGFGIPEAGNREYYEGREKMKNAEVIVHGIFCLKKVAAARILPDR